MAIGAILLVAVPAGAVVVHASTGPGCERTPQAHPPDAIGVPLDRVRGFLAEKYATNARYVVVLEVEGLTQGPLEAADALELGILDGISGDVDLVDVVRVVHAESGDGWLIATTNTCGD